jgi:hypothetical protein
MWSRIIGTGVVLTVSGWAMTWSTPISLIGAARVAGWQMANSDANAIVAYSGMKFFGGINPAIFLATVVVLLLIWFKPIKRGVTKLLEE